MNAFSVLTEIMAIIFGVLSIFFGILSLLSIKRDTRYSLMEARVRSLKKNVIYLFLCFVSLLSCILVIKPGIVDSAVLCLFGNAIVLTIYYYLTLVIYRFLDRSGLDEKYGHRKKPDTSKEDENNIS